MNILHVCEAASSQLLVSNLYIIGTTKSSKKTKLNIVGREMQRKPSIWDLTWKKGKLRSKATRPISQKQQSKHPEQRQLGFETQIKFRHQDNWTFKNVNSHEKTKNLDPKKKVKVNEQLIYGEEKRHTQIYNSNSHHPCL